MWRKYDLTVTFMTLTTCNSVCCMCGEAWSSRWLMTQLTNGQHAWVLVFVPMVDIWTYLVTINFFLSTWTLFHTTLDAVGNILRVHYTSMKFDVSLSQGSLSTLFRSGEHSFHVCTKMILPAYSRAKIIKIKRVFRELWSQMYCHVFYKSQCIRNCRMSPPCRGCTVQWPIVTFWKQFLAVERRPETEALSFHLLVHHYNSNLRDAPIGHQWNCWCLSRGWYTLLRPSHFGEIISNFYRKQEPPQHFT